MPVTAETAAASDAPEPPPAPAGTPTPAKPSVQEYRAAVAKFGLSPECPRSKAAQQWAVLQNSSDAATRKEANAAWAAICEYRGFRKD